MTIAEFSTMEKGKTADFVVVVNESTQNECREYRHMVFLVDITDETRPFSVSNFDVPETSGNFCSRGAASARIRAANRLRQSTTSAIFVTLNAGCKPWTSGSCQPKEVITFRRSQTRRTAVPQSGSAVSLVPPKQQRESMIAVISIVDQTNTGMHLNIRASDRQFSVEEQRFFDD